MISDSDWPRAPRLSAVVIGAPTRSGTHRDGNFLRRPERDAGNGRARAAEETAERAGAFARCDHAIEEGNELRPKRLVQMIPPEAAQILIGAAREGRRDGAGVAAGFDRARAIHFVRQDAPRFRCLDLEARNQEHEGKARIDRKSLMPVATRDHETAELSRGRIIGVPLKLGAEFKNLGALERVLEEGVQSVEHAEPYRDAAPESARAGTRLRPCTRNRTVRSRLARKNWCAAAVPSDGSDRARARHRDEVIELQGHPEAIEAGTEIRSRGGNAHRDLLLFQIPKSMPARGAKVSRSFPAARHAGERRAERSRSRF